MPEPQPRHTALSLTLLVFVVALLPRIVGLGWGLPYVEHADEPAVVEVEHCEATPVPFEVGRMQIGVKNMTPRTLHE